MGNENNSNSRNGIGFLGALTITFIVLKLLKVIEWSWLWVLSPIWIPTALAVIIGILVTLLQYCNSRR